MSTEMLIEKVDNRKISITWKNNKNEKILKRYVVNDNNIETALVENDRIFYKKSGSRQSNTDTTVMLEFKDDQLLKRHEYSNLWFDSLVDLSNYFDRDLIYLMQYSDVLELGVSFQDVECLERYFQCGEKILEYKCIADIKDITSLITTLEHFQCDIDVLEKYPIIVEIESSSIVDLDKAFSCGIEILEKFDKSDLYYYDEEIKNLAKAKERMGHILDLTLQ